MSHHKPQLKKGRASPLVHGGPYAAPANGALPSKLSNEDQLALRLSISETNLAGSEYERFKAKFEKANFEHEVMKVQLFQKYGLDPRRDSISPEFEITRNDPNVIRAVSEGEKARPVPPPPAPEKKVEPPKPTPPDAPATKAKA